MEVSCPQVHMNGEWRWRYAGAQGLVKNGCLFILLDEVFDVKKMAVFGNKSGVCRPWWKG